jgi:general secretion pathway protein K
MELGNAATADNLLARFSLSRRDNMKVATHEMPGQCADMIRPVGYGVIRGAGYGRGQSDTPTHQSYRTQRDGIRRATGPGISCQATFIPSLRDKARLRRAATNGSALLLVLFTLLLITGLILSALSFLESGVEDYGALNHQFQARQLARSGLAYGLNPQVTNQDTPLLNQKFKPNSEFHVVITSESTKLNINSLLEQQRDDILQTLFLQWNVPLKAVNDVINGLKKWTNGNQEIQPVGTNAQQAAPSQQAGIQTGQQQGIQLVRPFLAVSEMAEVSGFNAVIEAKPDWANYFTVWSDGTIDVNLADPSMISLVTGVTQAQATQFVRHIWGPDGIPFTSDDQPYQNWNDVMLQLGMSSQQFQIVQNLLSLSSSVDRVDSTGTIGNYSTTISVVAKRTSIPVAYLLWQEK